MPPVEFPDTFTAVDALRLHEPFCIYRPHTVIHRLYEFAEHCPWTVAYAVRANPEPLILDEMVRKGLEWFAVHTEGELKHVAKLYPDAKLHLTAVVKAPELVEMAYHKYRVRSFVVDHPREFNKIKAVAGLDATVLVRLHVPVKDGEQDEGERYGCSIDGAVYLMREIVEAGYKVGLCFNVATQLASPRSYDEAFMRLREVLRRAPYRLDMLSLGGGFPAPYLDYTPPSLESFMRTLKKGVESLKLPSTCKVIVEPGRALVADALSVVVRVDLRRGKFLYINDGKLGLLSNIDHPRMKPTLRMIRLGEIQDTGVEGYSLAGPSGYINDLLPGPFQLPDDIRAGDYLEFGQMGAYTLHMATSFHLPQPPRIVLVGDSSPFVILPDEFREVYIRDYWGNVPQDEPDEAPAPEDADDENQQL